jgi:hypothetical protein
VEDTICAGDLRWATAVGRFVIEHIELDKHNLVLAATSSLGEIVISNKYILASSTIHSIVEDAAINEFF